MSSGPRVFASARSRGAGSKRAGLRRQASEYRAAADRYPTACSHLPCTLPKVWRSEAEATRPSSNIALSTVRTLPLTIHQGNLSS